MNHNKLAIALIYLLAIIALIFDALAIANAGDVGLSTRYVAQACFMLLLSVWLSKCS